jgi:hypothetical protein
VDRIAVDRVTTAELEQVLRSPYSDALIADGVTALLVELESDDDGTWRIDPALIPGSLPVVVIGVVSAKGPRTTLGDPRSTPVALDVVVAADDPMLDDILANIERCPLAASSLAVLLRQSESLDVDHALAAESAVYSVLQSGPEFALWRTAARFTAPPRDDEPAVVGRRDDSTLMIQLNRPHRHNAFSASMRDALVELLALVATDHTIEHVELSGRGPSFCSGGDLGEFGSFSDPATAHRTRLARSPARLLHRLGERTDVHLHGSCLGAGIELAAFAGHVTASDDAMIGLPEVSLGLVPGAGGTVSLPRRIGRWRTAALALGASPISALTALAWGLVDSID